MWVGKRETSAPGRNRCVGFAKNDQSTGMGTEDRSNEVRRRDELIAESSV